MKTTSFIILCILATSTITSACTCGQENVKTRIMNGRKAERNRYPWLVSLLIDDGKGYDSCSGSLINDRYILTAAHCLASKPSSSRIIAVLGAYTNDERIQPGYWQKKLWVQSYTIHPNYDHEDRNKMENDIAIIKLRFPISFTATLNPICLPDFSQHTNLFIYGWGFQNNTGKLTYAQILHETEVEQVDDSTCLNEYWNTLFEPEKQLCAGIDTGICHGDSGGPLSSRNEGQVYQVGIASFGPKNCGVDEIRRPDVYEKITSHLNWIEENTKDAKWCRGASTPSFTKRNVIA